MAVAAVSRIRGKPAQASPPAAFASSLREVLSGLGGAELLFVRCLLPRPVAAPPRAARTLDARYLERQLSSSAVTAAATLLRRGYPRRFLLLGLASALRPLAPPPWASHPAAELVARVLGANTNPLT